MVYTGAVKHEKANKRSVMYFLRNMTIVVAVYEVVNLALVDSPHLACSPDVVSLF